ncbi:hypothetical protein VP01_1194g1 [Puccinia sorghi]|uniref:Uncharacterized protein n=1 Tax=Puccinia sorghi TaxID=27349 RepID=A0A0L6VQR3_9BASI|nr:hypothetical protein VP01_1194g1 [Puccinia sorghi]
MMRWIITFVLTARPKRRKERVESIEGRRFPASFLIVLSQLRIGRISNQRALGSNTTTPHERNALGYQQADSTYAGKFKYLSPQDSTITQKEKKSVQNSPIVRGSMDNIHYYLSCTDSEMWKEFDEQALYRLNYIKKQNFLHYQDQNHQNLEIEPKIIYPNNLYILIQKKKKKGILKGSDGGYYMLTDNLYHLPKIVSLLYDALAYQMTSQLLALCRIVLECRNYNSLPPYFFLWNMYKKKKAGHFISPFEKQRLHMMAIKVSYLVEGFKEEFVDYGLIIFWSKKVFTFLAVVVVGGLLACSQDPQGETVISHSTDSYMYAAHHIHVTEITLIIFLPLLREDLNRYFTHLVYLTISIKQNDGIIVSSSPLQFICVFQFIPCPHTGNIDFNYLKFCQKWSLCTILSLMGTYYELLWFTVCLVFNLILDQSKIKHCLPSSFCQPELLFSQCLFPDGLSSLSHV